MADVIPLPARTNETDRFGLTLRLASLLAERAAVRKQIERLALIEEQIKDVRIQLAEEAT